MVSLSEYQKIQEELCKDPLHLGHDYFIDMDDLEKVCLGCGAVYGQGKRWKECCVKKVRK